VVEHTLGKGEVESSILSHSTICLNSRVQGQWLLKKPQSRLILRTAGLDEVQ
jgi:hypothetical protein